MLNIYDFVVQNNNLYKKFEVDDLLFIEYRCLFPDDTIAYWTSSNYFLYILGGRKKWITAKDEYTIYDGEAIFVKKGAYTAQKFYDDDFCALAIFVPDDFIRNVINKYASIFPEKKLDQDGSDSIIPITMDQSFATYFQSVLSYFPNAVAPPKELLTIKFEELILNILASPGNNELASHFYGIQDTGKISVREIMENNFMYNMSLDEYARLCARSLTSFKIDFFETYRTSPGKWLTTKRLEYAKLLIETTHHSVADIAVKSGFKNTSHFVRIFKETYGKPPLQHRLLV